MSDEQDDNQKFRVFELPLRVYYEDTDAGGVVYHSNYLNFFERARTEMLRKVGFEQDVLRDEEGVIFAVRSIAVDYIKPARFNDLLLVTTELVELKKASIYFAQCIAKAGQVLCQAKVCVACLNANALKPTAIPSTILQRLN